MNDEEYGSQLLRPLAGEPTAPARIAVDQAMRDGRRMRARRRWSWGAGLLAVTTATAVAGGALAVGGQHPKPPVHLPPDPAVPAACQADRLPLGHEKSAEVRGGDPSGAYLVGTADPTYGGKQGVLVWHDGKLIADVPTPGLEVLMSDINGKGVAVGLTNKGGLEQPVVYHDGKVTNLAGKQGQAVAINDAGTIIGNLHDGTLDRPVRWKSPTATPEPLPLPRGATSADVSDIAEDGTIIGTAGTGVYLWYPDGTVRAISLPIVPKPPVPIQGASPAGGTLGYPSGAVPGQAWTDSSAPAGPSRATGFSPAMFSHGWIYGSLRTEDFSTLPYRYEPLSQTWQPLNDQVAAQIAGIGGFGELGKSQPRVYVGKVAMTLPQYAPSAAKKDAYVITTVNADIRVIAGYSISGHADPSRPVYPIIWRCN